MRKGDKKTFLNKPLLYEAINLRRVGYTLSILAHIFKVDKSSLRYWFKKYQIKPYEDVYGLERIAKQIIPPVPRETYKIVNNEKINLGKSYQEYQQDNRRRESHYRHAW